MSCWVYTSENPPSYSLLLALNFRLIKKGLLDHNKYPKPPSSRFKSDRRAILNVWYNRNLNAVRQRIFDLPPAPSRLMNMLHAANGGILSRAIKPQLTAFFTSATIFASSAAVSSFSAKVTGHITPSSRFAISLKPNVAYLVLNFCALWKKQTTLPSTA